MSILEVNEDPKENDQEDQEDQARKTLNEVIKDESEQRKNELAQVNLPQPQCVHFHKKQGCFRGNKCKFYHGKELASNTPEKPVWRKKRQQSKRSRQQNYNNNRRHVRHYHQHDNRYDNHSNPYYHGSRRRDSGRSYRPYSNPPNRQKRPRTSNNRHEETQQRNQSTDIEAESRLSMLIPEAGCTNTLSQTLKVMKQKKYNETVLATVQEVVKERWCKSSLCPGKDSCKYYHPESALHEECIRLHNIWQNAL